MDSERGSGCAAVLVAAESRARDVARALAMTGCRLMCRVDWDAVPAQLGRQAGRPLVLVEAQGVAEPILSAMLPRVDAIAAALDLPVVVAMDEATIDVVAAELLGPRVQLLCRPTLAERVTSIALAAELLGTPVLAEGWRENEAARLHRLNQEVARIAEVLARLTRREALEPDRAADRTVADRRDSFGTEPVDPDLEIEPAEVRRAIRSRRLRDQFFGAGLFEDPAWDMLLDLFAAELEKAQVSVSSLCIASAVAPTTALRWISKMSDAGLFERQPDPFDRRRAFMALSERASRGMRGYIAMLRRAGLAIA